MDREQIKVLTEVLQAYLDGKEIQKRGGTSTSAWHRFDPVREYADIDTKLYDYRVKPSPIVRYVGVFSGGDTGSINYTSKEEARRGYPDCTIVKLQEVDE